MRLNVGCGNFPQRGWVNIDITSNGEVRPDVIAGACALPYLGGTVEQIYLGHVLEHLTEEDAVRALREAHRVLAPGGRMCVVGPDIVLARHRYPFDEELHDSILNGGCRWEGDEHLWPSTGQKTACLALQAGWRVTEPVEAKWIPSEWPIVSRVDWQFGLLATKEITT